MTEIRDGAREVDPSLIAEVVTRSWPPSAPPSFHGLVDMVRKLGFTEDPCGVANAVLGHLPATFIDEAQADLERTTG